MAGASSEEVLAFYASLGAGEQAALREADVRLDAAEGADAATTFEKGEALAAARDAVDPGTFSEWCAVRWAYHRTYAYSFIRVAERLATHRKRLVEARVDRSTLMALASRPERAEKLLAAFGEGRRPTLVEAKALIVGEQLATEPRPAAEGPADVGGLRGLRLLHAAKRGHLKDLADRLERMIATIDAALAAPRVLKGELAAAVNMEARWAQAELRNLCAFIEPASWDTSKPAPVPFAEGSGWDRTMRLLYELGGSEHWPPKEGMADWLRQTVLPLLIWAARATARLQPTGKRRRMQGSRPLPRPPRPPKSDSPAPAQSTRNRRRPPPRPPRRRGRVARGRTGRKDLRF